MKYYLLLILSVLFISCSEDSDPISYQTEEDIIQYLEGNNIDAIRSESGLYYKVETEGNGKKPSDEAKVTFSYEVTLLDGTLVEKSDPEGYTLGLNSLLPGISEGLKYFDEGGAGTLIIPPALGYGFIDRNGVKAGSVLIFEIKVLKVIEIEDEILQYLAENELEAQRSETGLFFIVDEEGEGDPITDTSIVTVVYKGYLLDGTEFDSSNEEGVKFLLTNLIPGFSEGVTYFKEGGKGKLLLPPNLGYGSSGSGIIPPNAAIIFDIEIKTLH